MLILGSHLVLGCGDKSSDDDDDGSSTDDSGQSVGEGSGGTGSGGGAGDGDGTGTGTGGDDGATEQTEWLFEGEGPEFSHDCGSASASAWTGCSGSCAGSADHITYGPYVELPPGTYVVTWKLLTDDGDRSSLEILQLDITKDAGSTYLGSRRVNRSEFPDAHVWTEFSISATHDGSGTLEFRTQYIDSHRPCVSVDWVRVTKTG
jgi:hypothetical protein